MKIVINNKIEKLPRETGSVASTIKKAIKVAKAQGWSKIIIIGEGKKSGHWLHNRISGYTAIGLLEKAKASIVEEV